MAAFESLPPDQRAVLQLILAQGRSYDDLASVLRITPQHVRARAVAGARTLAGGGPGGGPQGRVVDYLLGQLPFSDRLAVRAQLSSDPALRAWALALSRELEPVATEPLPQVPKPGEEKVAAEKTEGAEAAAPGAAPEEAGAAAEGEPRRSLLGGALLLAGLAVLVVVLVFALTSGNGDDSGTASSGAGSTSTSTTGSSTTPTSTSTTPAQTLGQANLAATAAGSSALAVARLEVQGSSAGFDINAQGLSPQPNTYYGVWVSGPGGKTQFLGAIPIKDVKGGRFRRVAPVPSNVSDYNEMILSAEPITSSKQTPTTPTNVVLRGPLKLVGTG